MADKRFLNKYLWAMAAKATTLIPCAVGATSMLLSFLADRSGTSLTLFWGGLGGIGVGIGSLFTRLWIGDEKTAEQAHTEIEQEDARERHARREEVLNKLARLLDKDGDDRTTVALADLRAVVKMYEELQKKWKGSLKQVSLQSTFAKVEEISAECVVLLHSSYKDFEQWRKIQTPALKKKIKERREAKIQKVQSTLEELTRGLHAAEEIIVREEDYGSVLERKTEELSRQLDVMKRIDERTRQLDAKIGAGGLEEDASDDILKLDL